MDSRQNGSARRSQADDWVDDDLPLEPDDLAADDLPLSIGGHALAQAIVDTIREPLLVLDRNLHVVTASRSFYRTFRTNRQHVQGRPVYALGDGQWNVPELLSLLEDIAPNRTAMDAYEVEQEFSGIGRRTMLLNARKVFCDNHASATILLAIEDITERRARECELEELLQQKKVLLQEMHHRIGNSLQIIASILAINARTAQSEEARQHLQAAHERVMSVAAVQRHLQAAEAEGMIALGPYLSQLCASLASSMIDDHQPISLTVQADDLSASSNEAVSIGLIVTELVINALKHAFPAKRRAGTVTVTFERAEPGWQLTVSDNGIGRPQGSRDEVKPGLGTKIVAALARQLDAAVDVVMTPAGTTASIRRMAASLAHTSSSA